MHNGCAQLVRGTLGNVSITSGMLHTVVLVLCSTTSKVLVQPACFQHSILRITQEFHTPKIGLSHLLIRVFAHNPQGLLLSRKGI